MTQKEFFWKDLSKTDKKSVAIRTGSEWLLKSHDFRQMVYFTFVDHNIQMIAIDYRCLSLSLCVSVCIHIHTYADVCKTASPPPVPILQLLTRNWQHNLAPGCYMDLRTDWVRKHMLLMDYPIILWFSSLPFCRPVHVEPLLSPKMHRFPNQGFVSVG